MRTTAEDESPDAAPSLHILCIEDEPADVELCQQCLEKAGFDVCLDRVETREQFLARIQSTVYDLVLGDYRLPGWCGIDALLVLRAHRLEIPFILVTGTLGEDIALECVKKGVTDYVLKDRLARLPVAVRRALEEQKQQEARKRAEEEIARLAVVVNDRMENIGARRLHTIMERLLDDISFEAPECSGQSLVIDGAYVRKKLEDIVKDEDLSRYIL